MESETFFGVCVHACGTYANMLATYSRENKIKFLKKGYMTNLDDLVSYRHFWVSYKMKMSSHDSSLSQDML